MRRPHELVDWHHPIDAEATGEQPGGVAGEGRGVAGNGDHCVEWRGGECRGLAGGASARRVEHRSGVRGQGFGLQRTAREITALDSDAGVHW